MYYNKADLQEIFGFGRDKMKKFLDKGILPTVRVNKDYLISKEELDTWFKKNAGKAINI
ncbi:helix-turn-helix domain-containing protein [Lacrimispora indolis]|uniref:helix-turn-helix domain-containing protein n=1 Tax=Lacrimispora indolis TaxID=69825 RepID=UPI0003FEE1DD|nr:helix-turn-helix domain-containing protein [[Clostridium] methoxybenzovorans]